MILLTKLLNCTLITLPQERICITSCMKRLSCKGSKIILLFFLVFSLTYYYPLFSQSKLESDLLACYSFSGNAQDGSGNNYHGTVIGASLTADRLGNANSAYQFDGINDYIGLPNNPFVLYSTYTYSVWVSIPSNLPFGSASAILSIGLPSGEHQAVSL